MRGSAHVGPGRAGSMPIACLPTPSLILQHADYDSQVARINLERDLVKALTADCRVQVMGYTVRENYFNGDFSLGIENISYDALEGFSSPMFLRTVKLKDFPWNGWLQLGIGAK